MSPDTNQDEKHTPPPPPPESEITYIQQPPLPKSNRQQSNKTPLVDPLPPGTFPKEQMTHPDNRKRKSTYRPHYSEKL